MPSGAGGGVCTLLVMDKNARPDEQLAECLRRMTSDFAVMAAAISDPSVPMKLGQEQPKSKFWPILVAVDGEGGVLCSDAEATGKDLSGCDRATALKHMMALSVGESLEAHQTEAMITVSRSDSDGSGCLDTSGQPRAPCSCDTLVKTLTAGAEVQLVSESGRFVVISSDDSLGAVAKQDQGASQLVSKRSSNGPDELLSAALSGWR